MAATIKKGAVWKAANGVKVTIKAYTDKSMKRVRYDQPNGRTGEMAVEKFKKEFKLSREAPKKAARAVKAARPTKTKARRKVKAA